MFLVLVGLLAGCGDSSNGEKYTDAWLDAFCHCWEEEGWSSEDECQGEASDDWISESNRDDCVPDEQVEAAWDAVDEMNSSCEAIHTVSTEFSPNALLVPCE